MNGICNKCNYAKDVTLILGEYLCADCIKNMYFEERRKNAQFSILKTDVELKNDAETIIDRLGEENQLLKVIEELNELSLEVTHLARTKISKENLIGEVSDVYNMLEQLKIICKLDEQEILKIREQKNNIILGM